MTPPKRSKYINQKRNSMRIYDNFRKKSNIVSSHLIYDDLMKTKILAHIKSFISESNDEKSYHHHHNHQKRNNPTMSQLNHCKSNEFEIQQKSYISYKEVDNKIEGIDSPKQCNLFGYNPNSCKDKEKYLQKVNSLNKLHSKLRKEKDNQMNNVEMKDILYKFNKSTYNRNALSTKKECNNLIKEKKFQNEFKSLINNDFSNLSTRNKLVKKTELISRNKESELILNLKKLSSKSTHQVLTSDRKTNFDSVYNNTQNNYFKDLFSNKFLSQNEKEISNYMKTTTHNSNNSLKEVTFSFNNNSNLSIIFIK